MYKIFGTGAAGFIGHHLLKRLLSVQREVIGLDNINDYYNRDLKFSRIEQIGIIRNSVENRPAVLEPQHRPSPGILRKALSSW